MLILKNYASQTLSLTLHLFQLGSDQSKRSRTTPRELRQPTDYYPPSLVMRKSLSITTLLTISPVMTLRKHNIQVSLKTLCQIGNHGGRHFRV